MSPKAALRNDSEMAILCFEAPCMRAEEFRLGELGGKTFERTNAELRYRELFPNKQSTVLVGLLFGFGNIDNIDAFAQRNYVEFGRGDVYFLFVRHPR
jgi:hypothetical protein